METFKEPETLPQGTRDTSLHRWEIIRKYETPARKQTSENSPLKGKEMASEFETPSPRNFPLSYSQDAPKGT